MKKTIPPRTRDFLVKDGWKTPDTYGCREFSPIPDGPGLYLFLSVDVTFERGNFITDEVMYVGMSRRIAKRIDGHEVAAVIDGYTQTWFRSFDGDDTALRSEERRYIRLFSPRHNIIGKQEAVTGRARRRPA